MGRPKGSKNKATAAEAGMGMKMPTGTSVLDAKDFGGDDGVEETIPGLQDDGSPSPPEADEAVVAADPISRLASSVQKFVDVQTENAPVKKIPWSRYVPKTPFNPTGNKKRALTRRVYQNGNRMFIPLLHDEEISLLNQLRPGVYIGGMVAVLEKQAGKNTDLHIVYSNATNDQRMANLQEWRNLTELLRRCVTEGPTDPSKIPARRLAS